MVLIGNLKETTYLEGSPIYVRQRQNYLSGVYSFGVRTSRIVLQVLFKEDIPYRFAGRG